MAAKPLAIDLYCGLGGWTDGLLAEGWDVIGFDIERHVYGESRYPAQLVLQDVLTLDGARFKDASLIVGSSPCQDFSYRMMPWTLARNAGPPDLAIRLFRAQFLIQYEASTAAGRYIPTVVENVRGAQKFVGRSRWNFGSYHLWGDVPALMPITHLRSGHIKQVGYAAPRDNGRGGGGSTWFQKGAAAFGSKSAERKMASAMIAKIPLSLSRHIARVFHPAATSGNRESPGACVTFFSGDSPLSH